MGCPECQEHQRRAATLEWEVAKRERTIAGLREAVARWKARARGTAAGDPAVVRESLDARGLHRVVYATMYPATMPARAVWEAVCQEHGVHQVERIETRKGVWLVHIIA